jgi:hypothetical protein
MPGHVDEAAARGVPGALITLRGSPVRFLTHLGIASSGRAPSSSTPHSAAMRRRPLQRCVPRLQFVQTCRLIFSTIPSTGTATFSNIARPRVGQGDVLGRVTTSAGHGTRCASVALDVARAWGHANHQIIELTLDGPQSCVRPGSPSGRARRSPAPRRPEIRST